MRRHLPFPISLIFCHDVQPACVSFTSTDQSQSAYRFAAPKFQCQLAHDGWTVCCYRQTMTFV